MSDLSTFDGFFNTINKYIEKYKDNPKKSVFEKSLSTVDLLNYTFPWCGIDIVDWENSKTGIDDPRFKTVMDAMKWAYVLEKDEVHEKTTTRFATANALWNQEWLFGFPELYNPGAIFDKTATIRESQLTPVFFTYPDINNKTTAQVETIAAIPKASQNQVNAYNLLKIILSEDIQSQTFCFTYTPVLKKSARTIFEKMYKDFYSDDTEILKEEDRYINMLTNIDS